MSERDDDSVDKPRDGQLLRVNLSQDVIKNRKASMTATLGTLKPIIGECVKVP